MSDQNQYPNENPPESGSDSSEGYQAYTDPTGGKAKPETDGGEKSSFRTEILTILEGFGEEIKRLSKTVNDYVDKESFSKAAGSVREAFNDAGEGIKRTTQNMGEKLEEERIQRAIKDLKEYAKKTGKTISELFEDKPTPPAEDQGKPHVDEEGESGEGDINFENTFGG